MVVLIVVVVLLVLVIASGFFLASYSMGIKAQTLEQARAWQAAHYDISWYDSIEKRNYTVRSYDDYVLHAQLLVNPSPTERYVLISHGYTDNRFGALKYAGLYLDLGFNVVIYDLRGHGENARTFCTYSARERRDLLALIEDSRGRYADMDMLGIHGESLGAATSVAVLEYAPKVDFVVADCGFSNIRDVLLGAVRHNRLPGWLVDLASICAKLRFGYSYSDMRPIDSLADNRVPILFIHGADDAFIFPEHSARMREATQGYSELHLIQGAGHAQSVLVHPGEYRQCVEDFLQHLFPAQ